MLRLSLAVLSCLFWAPLAHRLEVDPSPFIDKSFGFDANIDFRCSRLEAMSVEDIRSLDYEDFLEAIKKDSAGKMSIMAVGDKLTLSGAIDSAHLTEQLPVLLWARKIDDDPVPSRLADDIAAFVQAQEELGEQGFSFILKPAHMSNGGMVLVMSRERWRAQGWTADMLLEYIDGVLDSSADGYESEALQSLVPGVLVQPRYPSSPLGSAGHYSYRAPEARGQTADRWVKDLRGAVWNPELQHWTVTKPDHTLIIEDKITCDGDEDDDEEIPADEKMVERLQQIADDDKLGGDDLGDDFGFGLGVGTDCVARVQKHFEKGNRPIEIRVQTVWGSAYIGVMWHGRESPDNFFLTREKDGSWKAKVYPFSEGVRNTLSKENQDMASSRHHQDLMHILEEHMPNAAIQAEKVAKAFKAPWLRVDFFVPATAGDAQRWGLVLNEVAYGSGLILYDRDSTDDTELANEMDAMMFMAGHLPEVMQREGTNVARAAAEGWKRRAPDAPTSEGRATLESLGCRFLDAQDPASDGVAAYKQLRCWRSDDPSAPARDY